MPGVDVYQEPEGIAFKRIRQECKTEGPNDVVAHKAPRNQGSK